MFPGDRMLILVLTGAHVANGDRLYSVWWTQLGIVISYRVVLLIIWFLSSLSWIVAGLAKKISYE